MSVNVSRRTVLAATAATVAATALTAAGPASASAASKRPKPLVVLVHGAFADASSWTEVIRRLTRDGYPVLAPANPLRGLVSDSTYLASVLATLSGPIVLVGHSYGGAVITNAATGNPNITALVYVAAFMPDSGETVLGLQTKFPGTQLGEAQLDIRPYPLPGGGSADAYVKKDFFRQVFAGDLPRATTDLMWATQRPTDAGTLQTPSGPPAWAAIPSFYLVARNDNVLPAAAQRFMAARARSRTVEVNASHVAMISQAGHTVDLIKEAACL